MQVASKVESLHLVALNQCQHPSLAAGVSSLSYKNGCLGVYPYTPFSDIPKWIKDRKIEILDWLPLYLVLVHGWTGLNDGLYYLACSTHAFVNGLTDWFFDWLGGWFIGELIVEWIGSGCMSTLIGLMDWSMRGCTDRVVDSLFEGRMDGRMKDGWMDWLSEGWMDLLKDCWMNSLPDWLEGWQVDRLIRWWTGIGWWRWRSNWFHWLTDW